VFCAQCGAPQRGARGAPAGAHAAPPFPPPPAFEPPPGAASFAPPPPDSAPPRRPRKEFANTPDDHVAGLCYIPFAGWVFAIIVLAGQRFRGNHGVRFHAFQGLYLFVALLLMNWVFSPIAAHSHVTSGLSDMIQFGLILLGVFMLIKTRHGETIRLPILGELAEKSVAEQK
jgi:uncharacterized membrane protein